MFKNAKINLLIASLFSLSAYAADLTTSKIEVISTTPLPSIGIAIDKVPSNIQIIKPSQLSKEVGVSIADAMANNSQGITFTNTQGNPFQMDVSFRGFLASPLGGNPQGLSVYLDGVRVNEAFGDVVNWDLIPSFAIKGTQIVPGSNPVYGLNTLGGSISIQTKDGRSKNGGTAEVELGSWGRKREMVEYGGVSKDGSFDYYVGAQHFDEDGWRKFSPTRVNQAFTKLGWQTQSSKVDLSYLGVDDSLTGNGLTPQHLLGPDRDGIHTKPDETNNRLNQLTLNASNWINNDVMISANTYFRDLKGRTLNGDLNDGFDAAGSFVAPSGGGGLTADESFETLYKHGLLANSSLFDSLANKGSNDGSIRNDLYDTAICTVAMQHPAIGVEADEAASSCSPGALNRTKTKQKAFGLTLQAAFNQKLMGKENQFITGFNFTESRINYNSTQQLSNVDGLTAKTIHEQGNLFFDANRGLINLSDTVATETDMKGKTRTYGLYATDTLSLNEKWFVTAAARYNHVNINNSDILRPTGASSLSGNHNFQRLNPSIGVVNKVTDNFSVFTNYSESSRAPTSMELGCANPAQPCRLPNAMAGDPPLDQVVARTLDVGVRGKFGDSTLWSASAYQTQNTDDIQFVYASGNTSRGYFKNVGETNRKGLDLYISSRPFEKLAVSANYSYIDARYGSVWQGMNDNNVLSSTGYTVGKNHVMPGITPHQFKSRFDFMVNPNWNVGLNIIAYSNSYVFGNENNVGNSADGKRVSQLQGYQIVNLDTQYNLGKGFTFFAKAINVFDQDYDVAGRQGETQFDAPSGWPGVTTFYGAGGASQYPNWQGRAERRSTMVTPGAPRAGWLGIRYDF